MGHFHSIAGVRRHRSASWKYSLFALLALVSAAAAAQSDPTVGQSAMTAQNAGVRAYEEGRYGEALENFQTAYRLNKEPSLLLYLAKSTYRVQQLERAKSCLFDFLRDDPKSAFGSEAFDLLERIDAELMGRRVPLPPCLTPQQQAAPPDTPLAARPRPVGVANEPTTGPRDSALKAPINDRGDGSIASGAPERRIRKHGPWSYAALGASAAAAGAAIYFGVKNVQATSDWRAARTSDASASAHDRARTAAQSSNIAWGGSAALLATGLALFFFTEF